MATGTQTQAEKVAGGGRQPAQVKDAVADVQKVAQQAADGIRQALQSGELRDRAHSEQVLRLAAKADDEDASEPARKALSALAEGQVTDLNAAEFSGLSADEAAEQADEFANDQLENGCYAYRFEQLEDGSILAVYVTGPDAEPGFAAFADVAETSGWHPVRAPKE